MLIAFVWFYSGDGESLPNSEALTAVCLGPSERCILITCDIHRPLWLVCVSRGKQRISGLRDSERLRRTPRDSTLLWSPCYYQICYFSKGKQRISTFWSPLESLRVPKSAVSLLLCVRGAQVIERRNSASGRSSV